MQPRKTSYADSVRAWAATYEDSVAVDYDMSQMRYIYVHKDSKDSWKGKQEDNQSTYTHDLQYWMVPTFFSIIAILIIFAFILYRDNNKALKENRKDSILNMMKGYENKKVKG